MPSPASSSPHPSPLVSPCARTRARVYGYMHAHFYVYVWLPAASACTPPAPPRSSVPLDANDEYWSTRAIFTHGIKRPSHFALLKQRWNLSRPVADLHNLKCHPCNLLPRGVNHHYGNWRWARVPCPASSEGVGRFCDVQPQEHFSCCSWAWDIPPKMKAQARWRARQYKGKRSQDRLHWA